MQVSGAIDDGGSARMVAQRHGAGGGCMSTLGSRNNRRGRSVTRLPDVTSQRVDGKRRHVDINPRSGLESPDLAPTPTRYELWKAAQTKNNGNMTSSSVALISQRIVSLAADGHHSQTMYNYMVLFATQEDEN
ncbi:hypothetical protein LR48_Vigan09g044100 [Vigna angularis]|uniref:Uncharacterized protein n=1 Tax=Phaseolus angularis TaxID=3914 RepID=A0A0L9VA40_PHAAN|nr:hypothetical protein LR48_Vigan09g044100 [Vigna angularis]